MKKIISIILICSLLLACFSGCNNPNNNINENDSGDENKDNIKELNEVFDIISADVNTKNKLGFSVEREQLYSELKNSGQYDNGDWLDSIFIVTIDCDYDIATNEEWYKQCTDKNIKSLNAAFYDNYKAGLSKGDYSNIVFSPGMHLIYNSLEDFNSDYASIKALADLDYVTQVYIVYQFGLPLDYIME